MTRMGCRSNWPDPIPANRACGQNRSFFLIRPPSPIRRPPVHQSRTLRAVTEGLAWRVRAFGGVSLTIAQIELDLFYLGSRIFYFSSSGEPGDGGHGSSACSCWIGGRMTKKYRLAELQLAIMQVLWERGEATVAEVRESLEDERPLAYTTISTMLTKMERSGHVSHRNQGRLLVYRPAVGEETVSKSMVSDLANRLFRGDVTQMVSQLLEGCDVDSDELARLRLLIREKEREVRDAE